MYKPHTIEQYKVYQFLKEQFVLEKCLVSPLSRCSLMLEDHTGAQIAFTFEAGAVKEIDIPPLPDPQQVRQFFQEFQNLVPKPQLRNFEDITYWWLKHPNPLTYRQALSLSDELYRHFLSHPLLDDEAAFRLASSGLVTESEYRDLLLWYFNGHRGTYWLGQTGLDGTGDTYCLKPYKEATDGPCELNFYLLNDYYRCMNGMEETSAEPLPAR